MYNAEVNTAITAVEETSWSIGIHDVAAIILFVAFLTIGSIQAISFIWSYIKKEWDWDKKPLPAKINLICRGIVGLTVVFYIVWLWLNPSAENWGKVFCAFVVSPVAGFSTSFIWVALFFLGYSFIYQPIAEFISWIKKK